MVFVETSVEEAGLLGWQEGSARKRQTNKA